jgi:hypothetical protein
MPALPLLALEPVEALLLGLGCALGIEDWKAAALRWPALAGSGTCE